MSLADLLLYHRVLSPEYYAIDEKHSFTVYVSVAKGKAVTTAIYVNGVEVYPTYHRVEVKAGDPVHITVNCRNDGGDSRLWAQVIDKDTGRVPSGGEALVSTSIISTGGTWAASFTLTMPSKNWNLEVWVGHVEE